MKNRIGAICHMNRDSAEKDIYILGIESSCDETAASVTKNGRKILSNVVSTQIKDHAPFGGVVPEIASRKHVELMIPAIDGAIKQSGISPDSLAAVAVTYGPGLAGALLTGVAAAKGLAYAWNKPLIGVNHISGHISANYLDHEELEPPFICLVASGGHSHIILVDDYGEYRLLGQTRDDAAGEAFDKVARVIGLGYPGGVQIDRLAAKGNMNAYHFPTTDFGGDSLDFSFSGIKTAVINTVNKLAQNGEGYDPADIAASFQNAVTAVLVKNTLRAAEKVGIDTVCVAGGVGANSVLRERLTAAGEKAGKRVLLPTKELCGDNAAMISCAGYYKYIKGEYAELSLDAEPRDVIWRKY